MLANVQLAPQPNACFGRALAARPLAVYRWTYQARRRAPDAAPHARRHPPVLGARPRLGSAATGPKPEVQGGEVRQFFAWIALVIAFGASGRVFGIEQDVYEQRDDLVAVSMEQYEAPND